MMRHIRRMTALLACAAMTAGVLPCTTAADAPKIVVLGDSITLGDYFENGEKTYLEIYADQTGAEVTDFSEYYGHTEAFLAKLDQDEVKAALSDADIIIVEAGMRDIMDPFFDELRTIADELELTDSKDLFTKPLAELGFKSANQLIPYSNRLGAAVRSNKESVQTNLAAIGDRLSEYTNAKVVFINTFNCMNTVENYDQLDGDRQTGLRTIINPISAVCSNYANKAIRETADAHGYAVVDAYSWIEKRAYRFSYPTLPRMNLTEEGQALIARVLDQAVSGYALGDVNGDSAIDAKDASDILTHSAEMGVGHAPILTGDDQKAADVNMDGAVNASDASTILVYSTSAGVGTAPTFAELAKQ